MTVFNDLQPPNAQSFISLTPSGISNAVNDTQGIGHRREVYEK